MKHENLIAHANALLRLGDWFAPPVGARVRITQRGWWAEYADDEIGAESYVEGVVQRIERATSGKVISFFVRPERYCRPMFTDPETYVGREVRDADYLRVLTNWSYELVDLPAEVEYDSPDYWPGGSMRALFETELAPNVAFGVARGTFKKILRDGE